MKYFPWLVVGVAFTTGCGDVRDGSETPLGTDLEPITGGTLVPANQHGAPDTSVVEIAFPIPSAGIVKLCTALKVSSNVYWTAAHCLDGIAQNHTISITNSLGGNVWFTTNLVSYQIHPSYKNYANVGIFAGLRFYDVARFTTVGVSTAPSYSTTHDTWVAPNQTVTYTGYGCDAIDGSHNGLKQYAWFDLDDHTALGDIGVDPEPALAYYIHNMVAVNGSATSCEGDSGAPVFQKFGATWKIIGIVANGNTSMSGFARYSNVRNWLAAPAFNQFQNGFQGFIFNRSTGRCVSGVATFVYEQNCDGRFQDTDAHSWKLQQSGGPGDAFYVVNGKTGKCLDLDTTAENSELVQRTCNPISQGFNTQRWRFTTVTASNQPDYRRLQNFQTGRCTVPEQPMNPTQGPLRSRTCTSGSSWPDEAWMMTR